MTTTAIIFDLDGTLLDTLQDLAQCMNTVLARHGFPQQPLDNYRYYVGEGMLQLVRNALEGATADESLIQQLHNEMRQEYAARWMECSRPYPGIREMLRGLAAQNICMGVLSNKPDAFTREMVNYYFPDVPFRTVMGTREGIPIKPDPAACMEIVSGWGLLPGQVLFLGDSQIDMRTATAAGCIPVGVLWGFRSREELLSHGALYLLAQPDELWTVLKSHSR